MIDIKLYAFVSVLPIIMGLFVVNTYHERAFELAFLAFFIFTMLGHIIVAATWWF
jgi:hypothetical protein